MATMKRNHNLEEISSDSLFDDFALLQYQTKKQKAIFIIGVAIGVGLDLWGTFFVKLELMVTVFLALVPVFIGVLFGCNYNKDVTLLRFIKLSLFDGDEVLYSKPQEDLEFIRKAEQELENNHDTANLSNEEFEERFQKRMKKMLILLAVVGVAVIILLIVLGSSKTDEVHHTVSAMCEIKGWTV